MFKRILRWLIVLSLLFFLLLQGWQLFVAIPLWKITDVQVQGNLYWPQESILDQLEIPLGVSIFSTDLKVLQKQVEKLPQVSKAKLYRRLPSTIIIDIEERKPWAKVQINGKNIILGKDGKLLNLTGIHILDTEKIINLKGITSIKELEPFAKKFQSSLEGLRELFPKQRMDVQALGIYEIQCKIDNKLLIIWGTEEWVDKKFKIIQAILPVIKGRWHKVAYIDVRSPNNLAIRYL
ncbi:cell division protein FtsQ/DivIB [Candidatus Margulisiibacteriota bacterium]